MLKRPASFVTVTRSVFVESWTRRTVAPGKRASLESVTVPVIEPRPDCAYAPTLKSKTNIASRMLVYISDSSHFASRLCTKNPGRSAKRKRRSAQPQGVDRPYSLGFETVGALYERPRCISCAKPREPH